MEASIHPLQPVSSSKMDDAAGGSPIFVNSTRLIEQLSQAKALKNFLFKEKISLTDEQINNIDLDELNDLAYKGGWANSNFG